MAWLIVLGLLVVVGGLIDIFLTVFNYDGFTFLAGRYQRTLWRLTRRLVRLGSPA